MTRKKLIHDKPNADALANAVARRQVKLVGNAQDFFATPFTAETNIVAWQRKAKGDFDKLAKGLKSLHKDNTNTDFWRPLQEKDVHRAIYTLRGAARRAARTVFRDMRTMREQGADNVELRLISEMGYTNDTSSFIIKGGNHAYHTDEGHPEIGRVLTRYIGAKTQNLAPNEARLALDIPEQQRRFLKEYEKGEHPYKTFESFMEREAKRHDNLYLPKRRATPFTLNACDIVRHACRNNTMSATPNIHRADKPKKGDTLKLLMIAHFPTPKQ